MKRHRHNGMTLIELLVVIAIMGILVGFSVPAFYRISQGSRMRDASKRITDTLSFARQMAITYRQSYYVEFDVGIRPFDSEPNRIRIFYVTKGGNVNNHNDRENASDWIYLPDPIVFYQRDTTDVLNPDVTYKGPYNPYYIRFKPNGGASENLILTIVDRNSLGSPLPELKTCNIKVQNVTGRIESVIE